jgi:23S rRNA pseudouridine955/2504/2580 synthase
MIEVKAKSNDSNQRITNFLRKTYPNLTLSMIFKYLRTKYIKVNNKKVDNDYRIQENDVVQLYINTELLVKKTNSFSFKMASSKIDVVYEDENILVVNKPLGVIVQDDESKTIDTLNARVQHYLYESKQ